MERLSAFDRDMNAVVQESRILAGVSPAELAAAGGYLGLRRYLLTHYCVCT